METYGGAAMEPIQPLDEGTVTHLRDEMTMPQRPADCWFCCGMIVRGADVLVVPYYPNYLVNPDHVQIKFPGGCGEGEDNTPEETLLAEMQQEVLDVHGRVCTWTPLHKKVNPCKKHQGGNHTKYGALVAVAGSLRATDQYEGRHATEGGDETNEKLGPPEFRSVGTLTGTLFWGHRPFLLALARHRICDDPVWWDVAHELTSVQGIEC